VAQGMITKLLQARNLLEVQAVDTAECCCTRRRWNTTVPFSAQAIRRLPQPIWQRSLVLVSSSSLMIARHSGEPLLNNLIKFLSATVPYSSEF